MKQLFKSKSGSTIVILSFVFLALISMIIIAIGIARSRTVQSWAEVNGKLWGKAVLSEYDKYLLSDYGIMAFHGNDIDVVKRLNAYSKYSFEDKLRVSVGTPSANLDQYRMSELENFRKSMRESLLYESAKSVLGGNNRTVRSNANNINSSVDESESTSVESADKSAYGKRIIGNKYVIETLPSKGKKNNSNIKGISSMLSNDNASEKLSSKAFGKVSEMAFVVNNFNSHLKTCSDKETFFANEYEYIVIGNLDDSKNFESCKRNIFLIRNTLNLTALSKDPEKMELIAAVSEVISPGPGAIVVQGIIMESWAALEAHEDVKALLDNKRVPFIKKKGEWKVSLESVLGDEKFSEKIDEESRIIMNENSEQLKEMSKTESFVEKMNGQNYEEYLLLMMQTTPKDLRTRRIMDLIQINMKYRYYDDFNFDEYNCGVRFNLKINGKSYEVNDSYK
ncbi:DUF5702 domain-containing protein [Mogibacterium pumilum]|uniref:Uncharacterized protein n=1 Tax=Mogibacterium pumilum TaxID=86332 RepID=A0A223ASG0_9FIRM|nr:DUF5702 domain-containing protein [Mogibacterium pumilum]ASS37900.1 hypothetical protein AXF17_05280 [Mogibacterium pumilum]